MQSLSRYSVYSFPPAPRSPPPRWQSPRMALSIRQLITIAATIAMLMNLRTQIRGADTRRINTTKKIIFYTIDTLVGTAIERLRGAILDHSTITSTHTESLLASVSVVALTNNLLSQFEKMALQIIDNTCSSDDTVCSSATFDAILKSTQPHLPAPRVSFGLQIFIIKLDPISDHLKSPSARGNTLHRRSSSRTCGCR